jgi:hypothetical protein
MLSCGGIMRRLGDCGNHGSSGPMNRRNQATGRFLLGEERTTRRLTYGESQQAGDEFRLLNARVRQPGTLRGDPIRTQATVLTIEYSIPHFSAASVPALHLGSAGKIHANEHFFSFHNLSLFRRLCNVPRSRTEFGVVFF